MPERNETEVKLREILCGHLGLHDSEVKLESDLVEDLGSDSLDLVEILMELEDEFEEFEVSEAEWTAVKTVQDALDLIHRCRDPLG